MRFWRTNEAIRESDYRRRRLYYLARYERANALRCVLENISQEVFVHEYVLIEEVVSSACARDIEQMIDQGKIQLLSPDKDLSLIQKANYHATCDLLADAMGCDLSGGRSEHRGEVLSVAIAKTLGIHIYGCISNESVVEVLDHLWSDDRIWIPNKELEKYADKTG